MDWYAFFPKLLNLSLTASVTICVVLLLRLLLKSAPKAITCSLWLIVLIRLLCPVSLPSALSFFSLLNLPAAPGGSVSVMEYVPENIVHTEFPAVTLPVPGLSGLINEALPQGKEQLVADPLEAPTTLATYVWGFGVIGMLTYSLLSYLNLREKLRFLVPLKGRVYRSDDIGSPFVVGLLRPKICLPSQLRESEQEYIILHEQEHIRHLDPLFKALGFLALSVHWFNPLVWLAYALASRDVEMRCDEAVIAKLGSGIRADYSASLLTLATGRRIVVGSPLAFGEGDTAARIKNLSRWKKPALGGIVAAVLICAIAAICLLTNPRVGVLTNESAVVSAAYFDGTSETDLLIEAAEALETAVNQARATRFQVGLDDPNALSKSVTIRHTDGASYLVHYQYYSGFSLLHGIEDDYRTILTAFYADGTRKAWRLEYDFDRAFQNWRRAWNLR